MAEKKKTFKSKYDKLKTIATEIESGDIELEESLKLFEEGITLYRECTKILSEAERKVTILVEGTEGLTEEEFSVEGDE